MTPSPTNPDSPSKNKNTCVDKNEVINALNVLIQDYPDDQIPLSVVMDALNKVSGCSSLGAASHQSVFEKFDQTIAKVKAMGLS